MVLTGKLTAVCWKSMVFFRCISYWNSPLKKGTIYIFRGVTTQEKSNPLVTSRSGELHLIASWSVYASNVTRFGVGFRVVLCWLTGVTCCVNSNVWGELVGLFLRGVAPNPWRVAGFVIWILYLVTSTECLLIKTFGLYFPWLWLLLFFFQSRTCKKPNSSLRSAGVFVAWHRSPISGKHYRRLGPSAVVSSNQPPDLVICFRFCLFQPISWRVSSQVVLLFTSSSGLYRHFEKLGPFLEKSNPLHGMIRHDPNQDTISIWSALGHLNRTWHWWKTWNSLVQRENEFGEVVAT